MNCIRMIKQLNPLVNTGPMTLEETEISTTQGKRSTDLYHQATSICSLPIFNTVQNFQIKKNHDEESDGVEYKAIRSLSLSKMFIRQFDGNEDLSTP